METKTKNQIYYEQTIVRRREVAKTSYEKASFEVQKRRLLKRIESGKCVFINTLNKYGIDHNTINKSQIKY